MNEPHVYKTVTTYLYFTFIGLEWFSVIHIQIPLLFDIFSIFNAVNYDFTAFKIDDNVWFYLFVYCLMVTPIYQLFLFCGYKDNIKSIGICCDFKQLLQHKCCREIYELMKLGMNYKRFAQHNDMNILCWLCKESDIEAIHLEIAKLYLTKYCNTFDCDRFYLPLYYALQISSISMLRLLILFGADIEHLFDDEKQDWSNALQCIITADKPSIEKIEFIVKFVEKEKISSFLNYQNGENYDSSLLLLFRTNDYEMMEKGFDRLCAMEYLIWNGANINIMDKHKCNVLHYAIKQKEWRVVRMLIRNGADVYIPNGDGDVPLSIGCRTGCDEVDIMKLLLSTKKNINLMNKQNDYGRSAMHYAACYACFDVIKYLIDRNGDCSIKDNDGLTPLHFALRFKPQNTLQIDVAILLVVSAKSNLNSTDYNQCSILHDAAKYQSIDIIDYLIKTGANIYSLDCNGHMPKYYSLGRSNQDKYIKYWKEIYLNHFIYRQIMQTHYNDDDDDDDDLSQLSNINHLEAFQTIISRETTPINIQMTTDIINR